MRAGYLRKWTFLGLIFLSLAACRGQEEAVVTPQDLFVPPTPAATALPTLEAPPTAPPPSQTPPCENNLLFLEDLSIPDGARFPPGASLEKRWLVQNNGTCNWGPGYQIRLVAGEAMGAAEAMALFPARSGTELEIQIDFTAPSQPGLVRSAWQAFSPEGEPFGDPFFMEVVIEGDNASGTPAPQG